MTAEGLETLLHRQLAALAMPDAQVTVHEYGGLLVGEVTLRNAERIDDVRAALREVVPSEEGTVVVNAPWRLDALGDPQSAYGPDGAPRTAVLVPVILSSGARKARVTVAITKLAEMGFERLLGKDLDLRQIARLKVESQLRLGGSSAWDPLVQNYFEVTSESVANLSRSLRRSA